MSERRMRRFREQEEEEDAKRGGVPSLPEYRQPRRGEQKRGDQKRDEQRQDDQPQDDQPQDDQSPDEWRRGEQEREEQQRAEDEEERGTQRNKTVVPGRDRPDYAAYGRGRVQPKKGEREAAGVEEVSQSRFGGQAQEIFDLTVTRFLELEKDADSCFEGGVVNKGRVYDTFSDHVQRVLELFLRGYLSYASNLKTHKITANLRVSLARYIRAYAFSVNDAEKGLIAPEPAIPPAEPPAAGGLVVFDGGTPSKKGRTFWQKLRGAGKALKRAFATGSGTGLHSKTRTQATPEALTRRAARRLERLGYTYKASEDGGVSASAWPPPTRAGGTTSC
jgi:hypothetical protein